MILESYYHKHDLEFEKINNQEYPFLKESSSIDHLMFIKKEYKMIITKNYCIEFNMNTGRQNIVGRNDINPSRLSFPVLMDIGIMGHCNNKCSFCYQGDDEQEHMSFDNFKKIVDASSGMVNQIALGGRGDPNEHPDFEKILKYCREKYIVPNYTTSGKNLNMNHIMLTKEYCGAVAVSNYNKDFTFNALNMFIGNEIKTNIHYMLTKENIDKALDLIDNKDIWDKKVNLSKLNGVIFLLFKAVGRGTGQDNLVVSDSDLKEFVSKIKKARTNIKLGVDACIGNHIYKNLKDELTDFEKSFILSCDSGNFSVYIGPDMIMKPCSFCKNQKLNVDLMSQNNIYTAWNNSEQFEYSRNLLKENPYKCLVV